MREQIDEEKGIYWCTISHLMDENRFDSDFKKMHESVVEILHNCGY